MKLKYIILYFALSLATIAAQLTLTWTDNSDNETGFIIERASSGSATFTEIGRTTSNVTTYVDSNLPVNTTYVYRVAAYNAAGKSAYSTSATGTTQAPPNPPSVLEVRVTPGN